MSKAPQPEPRDKRSVLRKAADNYTDDMLYEMWCVYGHRMLAELPDTFVRMYKVLLDFVTDPPPEAMEPSLANWERIGNIMITSTDNTRREAAFIAISGLAMLEYEAERRRQ
jgi:hypothetical protein